MSIEGAGAIDEDAIRSQAWPNILDDGALEGCAFHHILHTPLSYRSAILAEHSLARAWHIAQYEVKQHS